MKLIIVESPTKAKTISQFVKKGFKVTSSFGHVRDLPKSKLGIDVENNFEPQYIIPTRSKKTVTELRKLAAKKEKVILATDGDREGEAIAWHLASVLNLKPENYERMVFHEITKGAIEAALQNPQAINFNLVNAQQGRRVLDRLVGYKLSPFLWKKVARGLSAGRVQSVAVRLIVERDEEVKKFKPEEYWTIKVVFDTEKGESIEATLSSINGKTIEKFEIKNEADAKKVVGEIKEISFKINEVEKKETRKNPLPPFITSTLQQSAANRMGYSAKKTMLMAQRLYEKGWITYMRTDSTNLSKEALSSTKDFIANEYGKEYAAQAPRVFTTKSRLAQEAHEAIRPTDVTRIPSTSNEAMEDSEKKLYNLIWSRFVASQMPQAVFDSTSIDIDGGRSGSEEPSGSMNKYGLRASGTIMKFDGFLKVWKQNSEDKILSSVSKGESLKTKEVLPDQHFTEPPPRYTEASLIKALEEYGIGRPSTYAPIISVIQDRYYVEKQAGKFFPTEMGILVNKVLNDNFPEIVDLGFTAKMEEDFDKIAEGERNWQDVIKEFYDPFSKNLENKYKEVSKEKLMAGEAVELTNEKCEKCGKPMAVKYSRFGKFLACSGFPECRNTKRIKEEAKKIGLKCPKCPEGEIVERRVSKGRARGKIFWGCIRYPKCDYASWENPLNPPTEKKADDKAEGEADKKTEDKEIENKE